MSEMTANQGHHDTPEAEAGEQAPGAAVQKDRTRASLPDLTIRVSFPIAAGANSRWSASLVVDGKRGDESAFAVRECFLYFEGTEGTPQRAREETT